MPCPSRRRPAPVGRVGCAVGSGSPTTSTHPLPDDVAAAVDASDIRLLSITGEHAEVEGALPRHHDDPFDRMLIAQAWTDELSLVTVDRRLPDFGVPVLLAGQ
jgi:PIN domain nuclease of toxin-antitoxin system